MKVLITGSSSGMGYSISKKFLECGHEVYGIDIEPSPDFKQEYPRYHKYIDNRYHHYICDVRNKDTLPDIPGVEILINNAGCQTASDTFTGNDISTNLIGLMNCTEKYGLQPSIKAIINQASVSAHTGAEFPEYCASQGAVLT